MRAIFSPPGGQAVLLAANDRYETLLAARFGRRFLDYRAAWAKASERGDPGDFPLSLDLAVNSGCQLSCVMCPLPGRPAARRYRPMLIALYDSLMDQSREAGLPALTLGLASEPLLRPEIEPMIQAAGRAGIMDIRLGTNGFGLGSGLIDILLESPLTRLEISVDAFEPSTYLAIRRGGDLPSLERSIDLFLERRAAKGLELPLLRLSFLRLPMNEGELEPFLARWSPKADLVSIQRPIWFPGSAMEESFPEAPPEGPEAPQESWCIQPWQRLGIDRLGRIWPCCSWYAEGLLSLCAKKTPIAAAWRSKAMGRLRRDHLQGKLPARCRQCADHGAF